MMKIKQIVLICIFMLTMMTITGCDNQLKDVGGSEGNNEVITFKTSGLESFIRKEIGKPEGDITKGDVLLITELEIKPEDNVQMFFIADLVEFKNLTKLTVNDNMIMNIGAIDSLENLEYLDLSNNEISDISAIGELENLKYLDISGNLVSDYSSLSNLKKLEELNIRENNVDYNSNDYNKLLFISKAKKLKKLDAANCGVTDVTVLGNLKNLEYLDLSNNYISDISALEDLTNLKELYLKFNNISDISVLYKLPSVEICEIEYNDIPVEEYDNYYLNYLNQKTSKQFKYKINEEMPEFIFNVEAKVHGGRDTYAVQSIEVIDSETGGLIQKINIPELTIFGETQISTSEENMGFELIDLNFDGYKDIKLFDCINGNYKIEEIFLVWNEDRNVFEYDERLSDISMAEFDQEKELIYGMERGSAVDHYFHTYKYLDDEIVEIEYSYYEGIILEDEILTSILDTENLEYSSDEVFVLHIYKEILDENSGEFVTVYDNYEFNIIDDVGNFEVIETFDVNTEVGEKISSR